jgi:hypothetical protein
MRTRTAWLICGVVVGIVGLAAWSGTPGQEKTDTRPGQPATIPASVEKAPTLVPAAQATTGRDISKLPPLQQQMYLSAQRGAEWLYRANGLNGRFVHGYLPALKAPLEGDHYLRQVGAAYALARAARFTGDERYAARATQAILALLAETMPDSQVAQVRYTSMPGAMVNRLGAAGLLVLAINELPAPEKDLLDQSEQLCNYVRSRQQADGALDYNDGIDDKVATGELDGVQFFPGVALQGLMSSYRLKPASWKLEVARKTLAYYQPWWRAHKSMAFVPWQTAAYTEAYLLTKEQGFASFVQEMNDWLCALQYTQFDPRHPLWDGGFMSHDNARPVSGMPNIGSAAYAEGLAEACRVAREQADVERHRRYSAALERCLQFLTTLQYTEANTTHFAAWYKPNVLGAFYASEQDGNLRVDYTQHAICALFGYLTHVARAQ